MLLRYEEKTNKQRKSVRCFDINDKDYCIWHNQKYKFYWKWWYGLNFPKNKWTEPVQWKRGIYKAPTLVWCEYSNMDTLLCFLEIVFHTPAQSPIFFSYTETLRSHKSLLCNMVSWFYNKKIIQFKKNPNHTKLPGIFYFQGFLSYCQDQDKYCKTTMLTLTFHEPRSIIWVMHFLMQSI